MMRTPLQRGLRIILAVLLLMWPTMGIDLPVSLFAIAGGVILAYEGGEHRVILPYLLMMIVAEGIYGIDSGVLSLAYLLTALVFSGFRRWTTITPLIRVDGWPLPGVLTTVVVGTVLALVMSAWSIVIGVVLYGYGAFMTRIISMLGHGDVIALIALIALIAIISTLMMVTLRRIDVPFRRTITFG